MKIMSKYLEGVPLVGNPRWQEWINSISHMVGGGFGVIALIHCVVKAIIRRSWWYGITGAVYALTLIAMYTCSAVYHGLYDNDGKRAMRLVDHTMIYFLISGTITPYALITLREANPAIGWTVFGVAWGITLFAVALVFIAFEKTKTLQMILYIAEGWMVIVLFKQLYALLSPAGFWLLLGGGICYTAGAIIYGIGSKRTVFHCVFHFFVLGASIMHYLSIFMYVLK